MKADKDVKQYPCFIVIEGIHNHSVESASGLQQLRVLPETRADFFKYFNMGMTAAQAARFHQEKLDFNLLDLANHGINPSNRSVAYLRDVWLKQHYDVGGQTMFSAIRNYAEMIKDTTKLEFELYDGGDFTVVLVTEFMMRVHQEFECAREAVLIDTTSHVYQQNTAVTQLLCAGPAGAAPLGIIFTSSQDERSYTRGFHLLKKVLGESAFYGQGHPDCFITDDSEPEKKAVREVWPDSALYLCIFHILQQMWRWLCDTSHGITKEDRPYLIQVAKQMMYANSPADCENYWLAFQQSSAYEQYDEYTRYLTKLVESKEDWSIHYQAGRLLHEHQTNNFAESAVCIIKDIILNRCKTYNTCHLVMTVNEIYDPYMKCCLMDMALGQKKVKTFKPTDDTEGEIEQVNEFLYKVKSESKDEEHYLDMQIGICDCPIGQTGGICKHQIACSKNYLLHLPQELRATSASRQWLAGIALGKINVPSLDFFTNLQENYSNTICQEANISEMTTKTTENRLCGGVIIKNEYQENSEEFIGKLASTSKHIHDCTALSNTSGQPSASKVKEFVDFIEEMVKDYGDGELDLALDKAMKMGRKYCKSSNYLNSAIANMFSVGVDKVPYQHALFTKQNSDVLQGVAPVGKVYKRKENLLEKTVIQKRNLNQNIISEKKHG
ncbi:uncharacterized protein LOC143031532 isoform X2 [Oratosquilla oratoria]